MAKGQTLNPNSETLISSISSTPFVSAPSSPGRSSACSATGITLSSSAAAVSAYFFSAPASPTHFLLSSAALSSVSAAGISAGDPNFEFGGLSSAREMSSADELFINGQIRSGYASPDQDHDQMERNGSVHRRTRSVSPTRSPRFRISRNQAEKSPKLGSKSRSGLKSDQIEQDRSVSVSTSASTSRSSSSSSSSSNPTSRHSKRWNFIKDLFLHRSKSDGNSSNRSSQSSIRSRNPRSRTYTSSNKSAINGSLSPVIYKERAAPSGQVEEMRRRTTFLPYRPGLIFGCLGFRRYSAINGFARNIGSVSSR